MRRHLATVLGAVLVLASCARPSHADLVDYTFSGNLTVVPGPFQAPDPLGGPDVTLDFFPDVSIGSAVTVHVTLDPSMLGPGFNPGTLLGEVPVDLSVSGVNFGFETMTDATVVLGSDSFSILAFSLGVGFHAAQYPATGPSDVAQGFQLTEELGVLSGSIMGYHPSQRYGNPLVGLEFGGTGTFNPGASTVPEPTGLALLLVGGAGLAWRNRRTRVRGRRISPSHAGSSAARLPAG